MKTERKPRSRERGKGKKGTHRLSFSVSCQPDQRDRIKVKAEEMDMTVSELIIKSVLGE